MAGEKVGWRVREVVTPVEVALGVGGLVWSRRTIRHKQAEQLSAERELTANGLARAERLMSERPTDPNVRRLAEQIRAGNFLPFNGAGQLLGEMDVGYRVALQREVTITTREVTRIDGSVIGFFGAVVLFADASVAWGSEENRGIVERVFDWLLAERNRYALRR